nr:restriction endonuclease subunit S [Cellulosimicrobium cellulans]
MLAEVLTPVKDSVRVDDTINALLISVRLHGKGAVRRVPGDGKEPAPFTGNRGRAGQFVFSRIWARRGAMALIPPELDGVVVTNEFPIFDIDRDRLDAGYLSHYVQSAGFISNLERVSAGASGQNRVKESAFLGLEIPLPSLLEQRRIVTILDQANAIRAKRRRILTHFDSLTETVSREFFASVAHDARPLGDLATKVVVGHVGPTSEYFREAGVPFLRTGNVGDGVVNVDDLRYVTEEFHNRLRKSQLASGDVLVSRVITDRVRAALLPSSLDGANCANIIVVRPSASLLGSTILGYLGLAETQRHLLGRKVGSAQGVVNTTVLKQLPIPLVSAEDQRRFERIVTGLHEQRSSVERAVAADDELFASLQSRAFRGEL